MRNRLAYLVTLVLIHSASAMNATQSLGDVARQERARKKATSTRVLTVLTNEDVESKAAPVNLGVELAPVERQAVETMIGIALVEEACRQVTGNYVAVEELFKKGCRSAQGEVPPVDREPAALQFYDFQINTRGASLEVTAAPKKPGLGWFFGDASGLYYNRKQPVWNPPSSKDTKLRNLEALFREPARVP